MKLKNDFDFSFIFINLTDVESKDLNGFTLISKVQKDTIRTVVQTSRLNKNMDVIGNFFILDEKNNFLDQEIAGEVQLFIAYPFLFDLIIDLDKVNSRKDTCPKF